MKQLVCVALAAAAFFSAGAARAGADERFLAARDAARAGDLSRLNSLIADGDVVAASAIANESECSIRSIVDARRVAQKSDRAGGSVLISGIGEERSRAKGGVEASRDVASQRQETHRRIVSAGAEAKQGVLPFRRVATGIAAIGWWTDRIRYGRHPETNER